MNDNSNFVGRLSNHNGFALGSFVAFLLIVLIATAGVSLYAPNHTFGAVGKFLIKNDAPLPADAIVVLLGASAPDRVYRAYQLYEAGFAKKIVFGSGYENIALRDGIPENILWPKPSTRYILGLKSLGVPDEDIIVVPSTDAYDTEHELREISKYVAAKGWNTVALVTSTSHTLRTHLVWNRLSPNVFHYVVSAPAPGFNTWWKHGKYRKEVAYEYGALIKEAFSQLTTLRLSP